MSPSKKRKLDALGRPSQSSLLTKNTSVSSDLPRAKGPSDKEMGSRLPGDIQERTPISPEPKDEGQTEYTSDESAVSGENDEPTTFAEVRFNIEHVQAPSEGEVKSKEKSRKQSGRGEKAIWPKREPCLDNESMEVHYNVLPGPQWESMKQYQSFIVFDETFKVGEYIYINHSGVANKPLLKPDQRQFWVCLVLEVRASDPQHVYIRVWWLYWPDELPAPGGRRVYHGKHELLMSNDMGIVDALTVAGRAKVTRWDEWQDDSDGEEGGISFGGLYWRQWYNCVTQRTSEPRSHCTCGQAYNPDKVLVGCSNPECGIWMHDQCLIDDALIQRYKQLLSGNVSELNRLKDYVDARTAASKKKKSRQPSPPWEGKLEATLDSKISPTKAVVRDIKYPHKAPQEQDLVCLRCQTALD